MRQVRSFVFSIWFILVTVFMVLSGILVSLFSIPLLRRYIRQWSRLIYLGLPLCGIRYVVTGRENLPAAGRMLIASQHQSAFETMLWFLLLPDARYVMKIELFRLPLFGWLARRMGQIGVERGAGGQTMRGLLRDAARVWKEDAQIIIFPEGTRALPGAPIDLKIGFTVLARTQDIPVLPVTTDSGICWGKGALGKRPGTIHVHIHPALPHGIGRDEMMEVVRKLYENGPITRA